MGNDDDLIESGGLPPPTPAMQARSTVHEAGFVLVAALRLGLGWVTRVGRYRGHLRVRTVPSALESYLSDQESLGLVCAIVAGAEAEKVVLGERSLLGVERASDAIHILRDRCRAGLEPEQPTSNAYDLGPAVDARIAERLASARTEAAALVAEHDRGIRLLAAAFLACLEPGGRALEGAALRRTIAAALDADRPSDPRAGGGERPPLETRVTGAGSNATQSTQLAPNDPGQRGSQ